MAKKVEGYIKLQIPASAAVHVRTHVRWTQSLKVLTSMKSLKMLAFPAVLVHRNVRQMQLKLTKLL